MEALLYESRGTKENPKQLLIFVQFKITHRHSNAKKKLEERDQSSGYIQMMYQKRIVTMKKNGDLCIVRLSDFHVYWRENVSYEVSKEIYNHKSTVNKVFRARR